MPAPIREPGFEILGMERASAELGLATRIREVGGQIAGRYRGEGAGGGAGQEQEGRGKRRYARQTQVTQGR